MKKGKATFVLFLMLFMMVLLNADQMVMSPNIGEIETEFGITKADIGLIQGSFTIVGALISLLWGFLADKYSRKHLLLFSVLVGEIPCFLSAFVQTFPQLFITRALTGIGVGALFPVVFSYAGDAFKESQRAKVNSFLSTAISLGAIVGMVIAGFTGTSLGWRTPFIIVSLPNIVLAFLFFLFAEEPKRGAAEVAVGELVDQGINYIGKVRLSDYKELFKVKTNLILFIQGILGTIPWGAIPYYLVNYFETSKNLSKESATLIFIFFGVGNVLGIFFGGLVGGLLYKKKPSYMPLFSGITTIIGTFVALLALNFPPVEGAGSFIMLGALGMVAAASASMTGPNMKTMLMNVNPPENRGRIFSVFNLTDSLGTGFGQFFAGTLATAVGSLGVAMNVSALFWLPCGLVLLTAVLAFPRDIDSLHRKMKETALTMGREK
ncbi:MFS transporter [Mesotoga sp.]|jgi:MFS family permease|uniref:MFS transporter n=1 Tax=Mesotoga sp. TaxID=2053577 RepID=UPI001BD389C7|nr:MFS transporter [Mesotoga sp.]